MTVDAPGPLACPACGTPAVPGARFCFNCGTPLDRTDIAEAAAERRVVTVLFGDLSDFTAWAEELDPERVGAVIDRLLAALSKAVVDVGGHVDKLTGDGIMAVFGAPTAHEDDVERAVRCAAAMQDVVRRLVADESGGGRSLGLRVGLNTGEVLAGIQAGHSYTVIGDTVNTAARLSDAAGVGAIWAGRETALATMGVASWRALDPLRLKGKREPVAAYELVRLRAPGAERPGLGEEAPFIGRDAERGVLIGRLLDVVDRGHASTVVVTGEPGIGKTRTVTELARFTAEIEGSRVLWGRCTPYGEGRDLRPVLDWVRTACGITEGERADPDVVIDRVRRTVARLESAGVTVQADPILTLLGAVEDEIPLPRDVIVPGADRSRETAVEAVADLIRGLALTGPLLLIVDDLHWAVPEALDVIGAIARGLDGPILLAVAGRSEVFSGEQGRAWWVDLPDPELLPLVPLERTAAERLLRAYLGNADLDHEVREMLLDRSEGNPFFLAELIHLLVDRGLLRRETGGWVLVGELPEHVLPSGVQAVLAARFDGLDPTTRAVLRDAAVIGVQFADAAVVALAETDVDNAAVVVDDALAVLREREIVRMAGSGTHLFSHALARDVAYAGIAKAERARRHAAAVEWAMSSMQGPATEVDAFVGRHAERAIALADEMSLPPDDVVWSVRTAGFAALARLGAASIAADDSRAAIDACTRALAIADGDADAADVLAVRVTRGSAHVMRHELTEAAADIVEAVRSDDAGLRARALIVDGDLRRRRGDETQAIRALEDALGAAESVRDDIVVGEAIRELGLIEYLGGRMAAAEQHFGRALTLAERVGDVRGAGWSLQHLAWSATTRGDYALAELTLRRAAALFTELGDDRGLSWCAGSEAFVRLLEGRYVDARELAGGLLPLGQRIGDRWGVAACLTIDAFAAAELGDPATASTEAAEACALFTELGDGWGLVMASAAAGVAARCAGDTAKAIEVLGEAIETARTGRYTALALLALSLLGYAHLDAGDTAAAERAVGEAAVIAGSLDLEAHAALGVDVLSAQLLRSRGELEDALKILDRVDTEAGAPSLLFPRRQALAHHAGCLLDLGRVDDADEMVARALECFGEDIRSSVVSMRVLAAVRSAQGRAAEAAEAIASAYELAASSGYGTEIAITQRTATRLGLPIPA